MMDSKCEMKLAMDAVQIVCKRISHRLCLWNRVSQKPGSECVGSVYASKFCLTFFLCIKRLQPDAQLEFLLWRVW